MLRLFVAGRLLACGSVLADVHYADVNSANATPPYTNWVTAATNIQDAVDAAAAGDEIVVTNGVYATGERYTNSVSVRLLVSKPLTLRSVNGPWFTTIDGGNSGRCVYLSNDASLSGFTLTNGVTGGGGFGLSAGGGGAYGGTLNNCILSGNRAEFYGGAAAACTLNNCTLTSNSAGYGGGAAGCTLNNCTITGNSTGDSGGQGGGAYNSTLNNCIVYFNTAQQGTNYDSMSTLNYGCTTPDPGGSGNITNAPVFVDTNGWANLRLQPNSPCINAGNNALAPAGPDLNGNPRIAGGTVDIGAYEFQWPQLTITPSGSTRILTWSAEPGRTYQLQYKHDWTSVNWTVLGTVIATGATLSFADPNNSDPWRVYRVVLLP